MAQRQQLHAARRAGIRRRGEPRPSAGAGERARPAARARSADPAARRPGRHRDAGDPSLLQRAEDADRHQGQRQVAGASPRLHGLHRRQALQRRGHRRPANSASSGCSPPAPTRARRAPSRICGARSTPSCAAPASIPTAIPARRWSTCWRPIRATSCSRSTRTRSTATRSRSCRSRSGRACACWRAATASTASSPCWSMRRASATTRACATRSATISPRSSTAASARSIRGSRTVRWSACISSSGATPARRRTRIARRLEEAVSAIVRTWSDTLSEALSEAFPGRARAMFERYRDAFSDGYREVYSPLEAVADIRVIEGLSADRPLAVDFYHKVWDKQDCVGLEVWSHGRPIPLSERVPVLENMGFRVVDERTYQVDPTGGGRRLVPRHDAGMRRRHRQRSRSQAAKPRSAVHRDHARLCRERRLQRADAGGRTDVARRRAAAHDLALHAPDPRALFAGLHVGDAAQACRARREDRRAVPHAVRSARLRHDGRAQAARSGGARRDRDRAAGGRKSRRGPHRPAFRQRGAGGDPHQLLPARQGRPAEAADRHQVREQEDRRPAVAEAALRNLRLFAARRGRASALRQGGARRHPLVRPAAGLPHRNSRPGEGAAGQERGDRAGRLQGRLRAEAPAGRRLARGDPGRRHRRLQAFHLDAARHHRQSRPQGRGAARQRGAARRRRSLSGRRGRQGHRDVLRHRQRDFRGARLLAGRCLRLRRLGRLRPQEDGHHRPRRLGIGEAPFPRDGRRHHHDAVHRGRRRRHVGRRVRQRAAAREHHPAARRVRSSRHLHRSRSRSGAQLCRARAAVRAAALELAGLRQGADLQGRRRVPALVQGDRAVAAGAGRDRPEEGQGDAAGGDDRDPEGAGRSAVLRRHRHLHPRLDRNRRGGGRPRQRRDPHHRQASCAAR